MKLNPAMLIPLLLGSLIFNVSASAADCMQYKVAREKAQHMLTEAARTTQLWSTSEELLEKAEEAAASGDYEEAIGLANEARLHGELAVATAVREKDVWQNGIPRQATNP